MRSIIALMITVAFAATYPVQAAIVIIPARPVIVPHVTPRVAPPPPRVAQPAKPAPSKAAIEPEAVRRPMVVPIIIHHQPQCRDGSNKRQDCTDKARD